MDIKDYIMVEDDIYREPPTNIQKFDDWKEDSKPDLEVDIPEPDYEGAPKANRPLGRSHTFHAGSGVDGSGQQQKALLTTGMDTKIRHDLHREMMMNQKLGIDVLHKKSELTKELEKRKEREKSKKHEYERKNSFDIKMQEMANKVKMHEETQKMKSGEKIIEEDESQPEFLRIHSKINRHKSSS